MTFKLISFADAIKAAEQYGKKHLLLGNGFSIACKPDIFAYGSLFEEAKKTMSKELAAIFAAMGTQDFEEVIRALQHAAAIVFAYNPKLKRTMARMNGDAEKLKTDLIQAVAGRHPARPNDISDERYFACRTFLSNFVGENAGGKIYTMNYDLLLYWALMHEEEDPTEFIALNHDDGFRKDQEYYDAAYVEWQGEGAAHGQNIHYLHGALHLFDAGHQLQKYTWVNTGKALVDQANEALKKNMFPVFVAEGDSKSKLTKIQHSAYLHHNFKSFAGVCQTKSNAGTALFVFGHSFAKNDAHVLDQIGRGKIAHLFVSLYGDPSSKSNLNIRAGVDRVAPLRPKTLPSLKISFFDAASAKVWGVTMSGSPQFTTSEAGGAQLQALHTLINCGWRYVTRAEADQWRAGRRTLPFLEAQLRADLARINRIHVDARAYPFSEANIDAAVRRLADRVPEGVVRANERMTDDLMLGIALPQTIGATSREWPFKFIDWSDWRANTFQVTSEYTVVEPGGPTIRADLVLFVNGIPLAVIEVKASHVTAEQGVSQQIRNQKTGEGVPALFYATQLLLSANSYDPRYGTVGTPRKLWSIWKEREDLAGFAEEVVNRSLDTVEGKRVALDFAPHMKRHDGLMEEQRFVTPLDETIVGLCRPERLMRLVRRYMLFDGPHKKVARYQQVASIETLLKRTQERDATGRRKGGVVWHTQGSGKSLTMVMLAKSIVMAHPQARIVIVTDRTDLDDQITKTFRATGQEPKRAATGENLLTLIEEKTPVVTTLIHKFRAGLNKRRVVDTSFDVFVLVDESHRSQYGNLDSLHARMREVLPNACFIAFTGTPIARKEKSTFAKFGDLVQPSYSMRDAVEDKAVVPLLYEGREVVTDVDDTQIDRWFEIHTRSLSDEQRADLKRKMSRAREIEGVDSRLQSIAFDVGQHFLANFKGTGLKGQLAASSKRAAILLKKLFDEFGVVTTEVVISAPEMRESEDEVDEADDDLVRTFWRKMMERYGGEDAYNRTIVEQFRGPADPDIIIVVDKLLTGFDAPRNTVLYVARRLKEHGLLQAIARVNRVFDEEGAPDKPFGFIIDYTGVLKDLDAALASYDALRGFSQEDIATSVAAIRDEANKVPGAHAALLDVFKSVSNSFDAEAYARLLADEAIRSEFYARLAAFSRAFSVALASPAFVEATKPELLKRWKDDLGRFISLRASVSLRYAERVDWRDYEKRIRQLLDRHVVARDVVTIVEPLNIFDDIAIEERRQEKTESDASVADTIAHQLTRSIEEKWDEDPIFFEKFSKLVRDTIADFHEGRINELTYLSKVKELRDKVQTRQDETDPTPACLRGDGHAQAFWGLAKRNLEKSGVGDAELAADIALEISGIIQKRRKVGWQHDRDIENIIRNDIDDFFFEELRGQRGILIDPAILDGIVDDVLASARVRLAQ